MLPNGVETQFVRLAGDRLVDAATVEQLPFEAIVVVDGDAYWVVTRTELLGLLSSGGESPTLADLLSGHPQAAVRPATATDLEALGTRTRVVVTEDSEVVGVVIDAPPGTTASIGRDAPPEPPAPPPPEAPAPAPGPCGELHAAWVPAGAGARGGPGRHAPSPPPSPRASTTPRTPRRTPRNPGTWRPTSPGR